jgi:hypothetical protein
VTARAASDGGSRAVTQGVPVTWPGLGRLGPLATPEAYYGNTVTGTVTAGWHSLASGLEHTEAEVAARARYCRLPAGGAGSRVTPRAPAVRARARGHASRAGLPAGHRRRAAAASHESRVAAVPAGGQDYDSLKKTD